MNESMDELKIEITNELNEVIKRSKRKDETRSTNDTVELLPDRYFELKLLLCLLDEEKSEGS